MLRSATSVNRFLSPDLTKPLDHLGIAGLVVWYLASGAQGPRINTWPGHSWLGLD